MSSRTIRDFLKKRRKRVFKSSAVQAILGWLVGVYLRFVYVTSRIEILGDESCTRTPQQIYIGAFWHDRLAMMSFLWRTKKPMYMLISQHADGRFIAQIVKHLGINTVVGSTGSEGAKVFRMLMTILRAGSMVGITPDGPKGPRHYATPGVIRLAQLMGVPIVPMSYDITRKWVLRSWDQLIIPLPFSRCTYAIGTPIAPLPKDASADDVTIHTQSLAKCLNDLTRACTHNLIKD
ncbi:MAG: lysophospholipid acyltransferase family protein [Alphaproteobacteria bacterium]|nr:MAG: lysophospholipid acyltransferase family protein [Alphaproteobacteria bacterium]